MRSVKYLVLAAVMLSAVKLFSAQSLNVPVTESTAAVPSKKILVVYYSRTGNTKRAAEDIARSLNADIEQLIDKKDRSGAGGYVNACRDSISGSLTEIEPIKNDPAKYDLVVLGTPIWTWTLTPAVRTYVTSNKSSFKNVAVFSTASGMGPGKAVKKIQEITGKTVIASTGFTAGDLSPNHHGRYIKKLQDFVACLK